MANNYSQIMALVNAGNKMGLSNAITRDNGIPLDLSSVYETFEDAVVYAATKAIAYQNQVIAAEGVVYVIVAESQGKVTVGDVEYDNYLKPVGTAPSGDDASITVTAEGLVSIFGFAGAQNGTLPVREGGKLTWKTLEDIGAGDGNDNTTYEFALNANKTGIIVTPKFNGQPIMDGEGEDAKQVVYDLSLDVYTKGEADNKFLAKEDYVPYNDKDLSDRVTAAETTLGDDTDGLVKDVADNTAAIGENAKDIEANAKAIADEKTRAEAAEAKALSDAKIYTNEEISGITVAIEQKEGVEYIVVKNKAGTEIASASASKFVQDSFLNDVAYDSTTGKITFTWSMGDGSAKTDEVSVADFVQTYTAGTGLTLNGNEFSVDTSVIATVEELNKVKETAEAAQTAQEVSNAIDAKINEQNLGQYAKTEDVANDYATKDELTEHSNTMDAKLNDYAKVADVNNELAKKIETGTITHTTEGVAEGVTVDGTTLKIVVDAYTKAETVAKIDEVIDQINDNSETAAGVASDLAQYEESNDARVALIEAKDLAQDTAIEKAQKDATQALADAKTANDGLAALTNGQVTTNTNDITAIKGRLSTLETAKGDHETRIAGAESEIASLKSSDTAINKKIGEIESAVDALENEDARIIGLITGNTENITKVTNDLATLTGNVYTKGEVDNLLANLDQSEIIADIEKNATDIATNKTAIETEVARAKAAEEANTALINILIGNDSDKNKSVRDIAKDELNVLIKAADPSGNDIVIDNIANLVKYVDENAGDIAALITQTDANTAKLAGIGGTDEPATVIEAIEELIDAIPEYELEAATDTTLGGIKSSDEIEVAEDGTASIGELGINKVVIPTGYTLVLNGGNAGVN